MSKIITVTSRAPRAEVAGWWLLQVFFSVCHLVMETCLTSICSALPLDVQWVR